MLLIDKLRPRSAVYSDNNFPAFGDITAAALPSRFIVDQLRTPATLSLVA